MPPGKPHRLAGYLAYSILCSVNISHEYEFSQLLHLRPSKILSSVALKVMNMNDIPGTMLAKQAVECVVLKGFHTIMVQIHSSVR